MFLKIPQPGNIKSNYVLPFGVIVLVEHIAALWHYPRIVARKYLEGMRTGGCLNTKANIGMRVFGQVLRERLVVPGNNGFK